MTTRPRVFLDADVIFAGSAAPSEHGASHVILRMGEITLLECLTSEQAITEVERNLAAKLPAKVPTFRLLASRCLHVVADPTWTEMTPFAGQADAKDLPILAAAALPGCSHLVTFNVRHYQPVDGPTVQTPDENPRGVRDRLASLDT